MLQHFISLNNLHTTLYGIQKDEHDCEVKPPHETEPLADGKSSLDPLRLVQPLWYDMVWYGRGL